MLDGPVELSMSDRKGRVLVYRKMYGDNDAYITVCDSYMYEHQDEATEEELEKMLDDVYYSKRNVAISKVEDVKAKQVFRELFEFMVDD